MPPRVVNATSDVADAILTSAKISGQIAVGKGGTGAGTFPLYALLYGNTTNPIQTLAAGAAGTILAGTGAAPAFTSTPYLTRLGLGTGAAPHTSYWLDIRSSTILGGRILNSAAPSTSSGGGFILGTFHASTFPGAGHRVGLQMFGADVAGTMYTPAFIAAFAAQQWSALSTERGSYISIFVNPVGVAGSQEKFRVHGDGAWVGRTADQTTNYERLAFEWDSANSRFKIVSQRGGTGVARDIAFGSEGAAHIRFLYNNSTMWWMNAGTLTPFTDNSRDLGTASTRVKDVHAVTHQGQMVHAGDTLQTLLSFAAVTLTAGKGLIPVGGNGGSVTGVTIPNGSYTGQEITLIGSSDTNTVSFNVNGTTNIAAASGFTTRTLGNYDVWRLIWFSGKWSEVAFSNNL